MLYTHFCFFKLVAERAHKGTPPKHLHRLPGLSRNTCWKTCRQLAPLPWGDDFTPGVYSLTCLFVRRRNSPYANTINTRSTRSSVMACHRFHEHRITPDGNYLSNFRNGKPVFRVIYSVQLASQAIDKSKDTRHMASRKS